MHCMNTTLAYHNEFSEYMKVEGAASEDDFDYLFDVGAEKFLPEIRKEYLLELFEKWNSEHLQFDEDFDDYLDNDGLGMKACRISIMMTSLVTIKRL